MQVLDVGPGNGSYTVAAARRVAPGGAVTAIDIEPKMLQKTQRTAQAAGVSNVYTEAADVHKLRFADGAFDAVTLIAVSGELPRLEDAIVAFRRVLKPGGTLAFSELWLDPDCPLPGTVERLAEAAGFERIARYDDFLAYTRVFVKR
jgi:ubiquinone/menaquinone biosynthesis C-methylase UbiE